MHINKTGGTRVVLLTKNYVFKIPRMGSWKQFVQGMLSNITEGQWKGFKNEHLCPITYSNRLGLLVIMRRAKAVEHTGLFWVNLAELYAKVDAEEPGDYHLDKGFFDYDAAPKNFGYHKGKLVKIDYGV